MGQVITSILTSVALAVAAFGQTTTKTFELKDRDGVLRLRLSDVSLKHGITDSWTIKGTVENVSTAELLNVVLAAKGIETTGNTFIFTVLLGRLSPESKDSFDTTVLSDMRQPSIDTLHFNLFLAERSFMKEALTVSGFVAKDKGCLNDFIAARSLTGIALRKRLAELIQYDCGFVVDEPQVALASEKSNMVVGGVSVSIASVMIGLDQSHKSTAYTTKSGWAIASALVMRPVMTTDQIGFVEK